MSGGYRNGQPPTELAGLLAELDTIKRRLDTLERPSGEQLAQVVAELTLLVEDIQNQLDIYNASRYTNAQIDARIASPGDISPGNVSASGNVNAANVSASGQVYSQAPLRSPGSHDYIVTTSYVAAWINSDGTVGTSPSSRTVKKNLDPMGPGAADAVMSLTPYWGHYMWDDDGSPRKVFLIAEDVAGAGFGPDVAPTHDDGAAYTVNYSQLVVPLLAALQEEQRARVALEARVAALEGGA